MLSSGTANCEEHHSSTNSKPAVLMSGLGQHHHPVSTKNAEAQRFFDQGFTFIYAFNHDEATRSFKRAAELDPNLAMAHWGIALALGPNINLPVDLEREKAAYEAVQKALELSKKAPEQERAYIEALAKRYSTDPNADLYKLAVDYKNAMGELVKRYPDDLDVATLYAESAMNLRPWQLWNKDGTPAEGTEEIVTVLESVLKRNPDHIGANHYYIHTVEASLKPERALPSAQRLITLVPAAGHLVHMPAHIYMRTGDYKGAAIRNQVAAEVDEAYIKSNSVQGVYPLMYYSHNLHFLAVAHAMQGRFSDAKKAADQLEAHVSPYVKEMPMLEFFVPTSTLILVSFNRWEDILRSPKPDPNMLITTAVWHFARGMAYAANGKVAKAESERKLFMGVKKRMPAETMWDLNSTSNVLGIAENVLDAKIAIAKGNKKSAIELLRKAVEAEDALNYAEPSGWYIPVRESLGGILLLSGDYAEAEKVFRADLEKNPRSGRSLFGLMQSLKAQGKNYEAQLVQTEFEAAWKNADTQLRVKDL
jgi:tetratricopeptide (TPR) repeat protein